MFRYLLSSGLWRYEWQWMCPYDEGSSILWAVNTVSPTCTGLHDRQQTPVYWPLSRFVSQVLLFLYLLHKFLCIYDKIDQQNQFLCLWFRVSLIYINNCPTRCNTKQSIYYSASSLYMFRVSTTPNIRSTQNCNYSLGHVGQVALDQLEGGSCTKNMTSTGGCSYSFVYSWWWVWLKPETCRVNLHNNK